MGCFLFAAASRLALEPIQPVVEVPGVLTLGIKRPGREAYHPLPSDVEVKNSGSYTTFPQYIFMA
jgi:hypothetical protein